MTSPFDKTAASDGDTGHSDEAYCSACNQSFALDRDVCPNDGARLVKLKATRDVLLGRVFDQRYEVRTALGHGGMGTVYRAHQLSVDREVAIKVIHPKLASDRVAVKRFLREARLASRLSQPNVVNVYDFGQTDDGILYLVMELLRGHTLAHELEDQRPLPLRRVLGISLQLCDALEVAHAQGIVHRDLKPGNVIVLDDPPGRDLIKVLDFGLAKSLVTDTSSLITASSALLGTPLYMPPEQIGGDPSDQRADLYALGCILHHMLSGRPPFVRENVNAVLAAHVYDAPPPLPPGVPAAIGALVAALMAKQPSERPASAAQVRAVLQSVGEAGTSDVADTIPVPAATSSATASLAHAATIAPHAPAMTPPPARSRRWLVLAAATTAAVAVAGITAVALRRSASVPPASGSPGSAAPTLDITPAAAPIDASAPSVAAPADASTPAAIPPPVRDAASEPAPASPPVDAAVHSVRPPVRPHPHAPVDAAAPAGTHADSGMPSIDFTK